jgi:hypothetical protein
MAYRVLLTGRITGPKSPSSEMSWTILNTCFQDPWKLLRMKRGQLKSVTGRCTSHCCLKGHLCKVGLTCEVLTEATMDSTVLWGMKPQRLVEVYRCLLSDKLFTCLHSSFSDSEDGDNMLLRNFDKFLPDYTESRPWKYSSWNWD